MTPNPTANDWTTAAEQPDSPAFQTSLSNISAKALLSHSSYSHMADMSPTDPVQSWNPWLEIYIGPYWQGSASVSEISNVFSFQFHEDGLMTCWLHPTRIEKKRLFKVEIVFPYNFIFYKYKFITSTNITYISVDVTDRVSHGMFLSFLHYVFVLIFEIYPIFRTKLFP